MLSANPPIENEKKVGPFRRIARGGFWRTRIFLSPRIQCVMPRRKNRLGSLRREAEDIGIPPTQKMEAMGARDVDGEGRIPLSGGRGGGGSYAGGLRKSVS